MRIKGFLPFICVTNRVLNNYTPFLVRSSSVTVSLNQTVPNITTVKRFSTILVSRPGIFGKATTISTTTSHLSVKNYCTMPEKKAFERLPKDVTPSNYILSLKPNLTSFTFEGTEEISVKVSSSTKTIVLNSADIEVKSAKYSGNGQDFEKNIEVSYTKDDETVTLAFPEELKAGDGTLSLTFTGELNDKMKGFYRSKYTGPDGKEERYAAVTQFEATDARRAFPCWDEPAVKATFDVTLVVPSDRVALSNMPEKSNSPDPNDSTYKVVQYERTPIMSTYLLAFVVGEYDFVEGVDSDGVKVRVYTPVGKKEQGQFALEVAVKTLPFYHQYFKIAYPLPKMDLIAIADFAAGAMENWGLVTYRETALLIDPANSSHSSRQWVALVVGHEIAHQWFGNLVTMEWWTHLWLNEGFASWIEYLCVDHCFPEFDIWTQFASSDFTKALDLDGLKNSHPIEVPVGHPDEIDEIFDAISYSKGASVIRMLHDFIGDEDFRKGMNAYLNEHKYKNTFTEDLWAKLGEASGKPVQDIMTSWTKQMGFPVLSVEQTTEGGKRTLKINQKKFCADGQPDEKNSQWKVPVSISTASSPDKAVQKLVLDTPDVTATLDDVKEGDWVKLNTGAVGFYRTLYTSEMLDALLPAISNGSLPPRDRLGLQNDLFALCRSGSSSTVDVLKVVEAFKTESNYTVWSDLISNLGEISVILQYTDFFDSFKAFRRNLYRTIVDKLGWTAKDGESPLDTMLRGLVISQMGRAGDEATVAEAKKRFQAHCDGSATLPADLRGPVYGIVLSQGGEEEYDAVLKLFRSADLQEERMRILRSLGSTKNEKLIQRTLEFAVSDEVRNQDTVFVIGGVTGSVKGREMAWSFVQERWDKFYEQFNGMFLLSRLVSSVTEKFASEERAKEVEAFFETHKAPAAERTIQQSLENIRLNAKQLARDGAAVQEYLSQFK